MDFSTAVTLESYFLTLGGVSILFLSEDMFWSFAFAGAPQCILNASSECSSCTYVQVICVTRSVTLELFLHLT